MTDSQPADSDRSPTTYPVELNASDVALVRTALRLLLSTLGREEAEELEEVKALLARLPDESVGGRR